MANSHAWIGTASIVVPNVVANSAYAANDALGSAFEVVSVGGYRGGAVYSINMFDRGTASPNLRLHMFAGSASGSVNGATFEVADADESKYIGYVNISTWVSAGTAKKVANVTNPGQGIVSISGTRSIWGQFEAVAGFTPGNTANPFKLNMLTIMD